MQRKVREVINESTERPVVAHKRRRPKKDEKPKNLGQGTPHYLEKRRGKRTGGRGRNSQGRDYHGAGHSEETRACEYENKQGSNMVPNLAANRHGNRESHAERTVSHKSTGVAMDQHSTTGSGHGDHPQC